MAREIHFVCEHLENVSRAALEKYQDIVRHHVRRRQGVYALYRRGKLYYVGLASNLRSRLHMHLRDRHCDSWDRFSVYLTKSDTHLRELGSDGAANRQAEGEQTDRALCSVSGHPSQ